MSSPLFPVALRYLGRLDWLGHGIQFLTPRLPRDRRIKFSANPELPRHPKITAVSEVINRRPRCETHSESLRVVETQERLSLWFLDPRSLPAVNDSL
jgi:hypothetical protein